jgi:hypothetical protein
MALKKPIVLYDGQLAQIQSGDELDAVVTEVDVVNMTNKEVGAITIGMPVYLFAADQVKKAKADAAGTARVLGLVRAASIGADASGEIVTDGILASEDWTDVVGSETLTPGSVYYLSADTPGELTATAPTSGYVVEVGQAISTTELEISQKSPIKL